MWSKNVFLFWDLKNVLTRALDKVAFAVQVLRQWYYRYRINDSCRDSFLKNDLLPWYLISVKKVFAFAMI